MYSNAERTATFAVPRIYFRVVVPTMDRMSAKGENTCLNADNCHVDWRYTGIVLGSFTAEWYAEAEHPCFNKGQRWSTTDTWYQRE